MNSVATFLNGFSESSDEVSLDGSFSDRLWRLLDRTDYRAADTDTLRQEIFRLRYQAYLRDGGIRPNASRSFADRYDEMDNTYLFGVYVDQELAGSIRVHIVSKDRPECPSLEAFPDFLQPEIDAGKTIIDSSRFVSDERLSRLHRGLPYAISRLSGLAAHHFGADQLLAAVRVEHQVFYRRTFHHRVVCEPRPYPGLARKLSLMTAHYPTFVERVHRRFPFFRSTYFERRTLFGHGRDRCPSVQELSQRHGNFASFIDLGSAGAAQ
jgi:N-acyl-L-homoserine lactone synthetase